MSQQELDEAKRRLDEQQTKIDAQERELARLREADLLREAHKAATAQLSEIALPQVTRDRIAAQIGANPPTKDGALDREALTAKVTETATAEAAYLATVNGGNPVRDMGPSGPASDAKTPTLEESQKRIDAALKGL